MDFLKAPKDIRRAASDIILWCVGQIRRVPKRDYKTRVAQFEALHGVKWTPDSVGNLMLSFVVASLSHIKEPETFRHVLRVHKLVTNGQQQRELKLALQEYQRNHPFIFKDTKPRFSTSCRNR